MLCLAREKRIVKGMSSDRLPDFLDHSKRVKLPVDDANFWLGLCERYLVAMERFLENEAIAIRDRYRDIGADLVAGGYLEALEGFFPDILRMSLFTVVYSLAETELNDRCESIRKRDNLSSSFVDLKGAPDKSIKRARKYLVKVAGIKLPNSREWCELMAYQKLRNCVVHNQGRLTSSKNDKRLEYLRKKYIPHQPYLSIDSLTDEVIFHKGFCEEVIKTVRVFFEQVYAALRKSKPRP